MENYEKAYKEALEAMKDCEPDKNGYVTVRPCDIFTELKESEDEKIRKGIIKFLIDVNNGAYTKSELEIASWIAWLEKQKPIEHFELKEGHWYVCHRAFCCRADHLTIKEGEKFMCEKDGVAKGFIIKDPEKYFKETVPPAPYEDEQGEQKSKWTEEDEENLRDIISAIHYIPYQTAEAEVERTDWLQSLKQRMEEQNESK